MYLAQLTHKIRHFSLKQLTKEQIFMLSVLLVNGGNYLYNLILGRILGPAAFADAAILITFLLVLSFMAMTFQLVTAKFTVLIEHRFLAGFVSKVFRIALIFGFLVGLLIIVFAAQLQSIFNTSSSWMFVLFGAGVPLYFLMSVNRGVYQGNKDFTRLSITYQTEMISRLLLTLALLYILKDAPSAMLIAVGILCSFAFGLIPLRTKEVFSSQKQLLPKEYTSQLKKFFLLTAFYELTQIIINNSDILLVKHYFDAHQAGLYASLALIGRMVYFIAWMFVMLLLPTVVQLKKEGKETAPVLIKYVTYIAGISGAIVLACLLFPDLIVQLLFGSAYTSIAPLLWQYAIATSLFAISNIFAYYYLSLDNYMAVIISGIFGLLQILLIIIYHHDLEQVVHMQIIAMACLFVLQLLFFAKETKANRKQPKNQ